MNSSHETFLDPPIVVDDFGNRSEAVSGARSVGDDSLVALVLIMVNTKYVDGSVVLGGSGHDDFLGASIKVKLGLLLGEVSTSAISDVLTADVSPFNLRGILLLEDSDLLTIDFDATLDFLNSTVEAT